MSWKAMKSVRAICAGAALFAVGVGCENAGNDSNGGSGSSTYSDSLINSDVIFGILSATENAFNQNVAGKRAGSQNITAPCDGGGTVHITGTTAYSSGSGITTENLTYNFQNCRTIVRGTDTTVSFDNLNGSVTVNGTWRQATALTAGYENKMFDSGSITVDATLTRSNLDPGRYDGTCGLSATVKSNTAVGGQKTTGSTTGSMCGNEASWQWTR